MTPRQGGQDFDLRRARDAPSPGASRSHRQAVPLPMEADPLQATPEVTQQAKTYGSEPVAGNNNGYIMLITKLIVNTVSKLNCTHN